jgi:hypothetical protein
MGTSSTFVLVVSALLAAACGGGSDGGPPSVANSQKSASPGEEIASQVGTCQPLCCCDAECGSGKACTPFVAAAGTLGVCASGRDDATSSDPAAGSTLSASCFGDSECNALTGEGCVAGDACDFAAGNAGVQAVVSCFGGNNVQGPGESCDNALGPWCVPGFHCVAE